MDVFEKYLTFPGKTDPLLSIFEHSLYVLQVANYLIDRNAGALQNPRLVRAGALCHDAGKIAGDIKSGKWIHTPHTAEFLGELLDHPRMKELLASADASVTNSERDILLKACETHHYHSPDLLRRCKDLVLVPVADVLASASCAGVIGPIRAVLETSPYLEVTVALLRSLGFTGGLDSEIHRVDLPCGFVEDLLLADMVFRLLRESLEKEGIVFLLQKDASLWIVGASVAIRSVLTDFRVDPKQLYDSVFEEQIYDSILSQFPPGAIQIDILRYLLINERIATKMAIALCTRDKPRTLFEKYNLSHVVNAADKIFDGGLKRGIDALWKAVETKLSELCPALDLPSTLGDDVERVAKGELNRNSLALFAKPKTRVKSKKARKLTARADKNTIFLESLQANDKKFSSDLEDFLKLFDFSSNSYRSVTNIFLELIKMQSDIFNGVYSLPLKEVVRLDGQSLRTANAITNRALCPICRQFTQGIKAPALITGKSEGDSQYYAFKKSREGAIEICRWCFITGYVDLPIANIKRESNSIHKDREYLLIASPLSKQKLQWLIDFIQRGTAVVEEEDPEATAEQDSLDASELAELEAMMGVGGGFDELAVLGISRRRLAHVKGFVLPTGNVVGNFMGIRVPTERFVGGRDPKVSGAVRRELVKATMYDLHRVTGASAMHFGTVISDCSFSMAGKPINLEEMRRANVAYRIADRYARYGRYRQLDSGLFMLLLSNSREAVTQMLRREARGDYVPGEEKIRGVIEMAESIVEKDWKFDLGLRITSVLIDVDLLPKARGFWKSPQERFSGVELTKWLQRLKVARDDATLRQWATQLINALKAGRVASREFKEARGIEIRPPGEETIGKILGLAEEILQECKAHNCRLAEFSRGVANTDYYLLFYHNQQAKEAGQ